MNTIKLPRGEHAPHDADCISILEREDGRFDLNGTALLNCGDSDEAESVALIGGDSYPTHDEAEAAGLAWAETHCAGTVYISTLPPGVLPG